LKRSGRGKKFFRDRKRRQTPHFTAATAFTPCDAYSAAGSAKFCSKISSLQIPLDAIDNATFAIVFQTFKRPTFMSSAAEKPLRILVVEDDRVGRNTLVRILSLLGYQLRSASTLAEARPLLDGSDAVLLDLMLPDGDGASLLAFIRAKHPAIRVAITTALHNPAHLSEVRALRPHALFIKPLDLNALLEWLKKTDEPAP
jgi:CheY-like chemotaxis protein